MPKYPHHFSASKKFLKILDSFENGVHNCHASNTTLWISGNQSICQIINRTFHPASSSSFSPIWEEYVF